MGERVTYLTASIDAAKALDYIFSSKEDDDTGSFFSRMVENTIGTEIVLRNIILVSLLSTTTQLLYQEAVVNGQLIEELSKLSVGYADVLKRMGALTQTAHKDTVTKIKVAKDIDCSEVNVRIFLDMLETIKGIVIDRLEDDDCEESSKIIYEDSIVILDFFISLFQENA